MIDFKEIKKFNNRTFLLAISGGVDSMVMLSIFINYREMYNFNLEIAHFNHLTRDGDSDIDEDFVRSFAKKNNIKFYSDRYSIKMYSKENNVSEEEAGRLLRFKFFNNIISNSEKKYVLALAHNLDDQIETILMRIIRGTGTKGLEGMLKIDSRDNYILYRPLLDYKKEEIIQYAKDNKIDFVQDITNFENNYNRNKIRNQLIPYIKNNFNSNIYDAILKLSGFVKQQNEFIENNLNKKFKDSIIEMSRNFIKFDSKVLKLLSDFEILEIIRMAINKIGTNYDFTKNHYDEIIKIINSQKGVSLEINNLIFYNSFDSFNIRFLKKNDLDKSILISENSDIQINGFSIMIEFLGKSKNIIIRKRKNGDKILLGQKNKKLKDFLIDKKVDKYFRDYLPIIEYNNEIIGVSDLFIKDIENINIIVKRSKYE